MPHDLSRWQHRHDYATGAQHQAEQRTLRVVALTFLAMLGELAAGWLTGSMALLADAWHMASHVGALGLTAFAYRFARHHTDDPRFTFGTGKVSALAGYTSALLLGFVAFWMVWESLQRLWRPMEIHYAEAMAVAVLGLVVNLVSAWLLDHDGPDHHHDHVDHNLQAAYLHVLADALTSVLALLALAGGLLYGWRFLDPLMGIVGAALLGRWAWGLAGESASMLLDAEDHEPVARQVRALVETLPDHEVADLHLWRLGPSSRACILSVVSHDPLPAEHYRGLLAAIAGLDHVTVEVHQCRQEGCIPRKFPSI